MAPSLFEDDDSFYNFDHDGIHSISETYNDVISPAQTNNNLLSMQSVLLPQPSIFQQQAHTNNTTQQAHTNNTTQQAQTQTKRLLQQASLISTNQAPKLILDRDVHNLHISNTKSLEELRRNLLIISNASRSPKNHAVLLMNFYYDRNELVEPDVNATGRAMRGSNDKKFYFKNLFE